MTAATAGSPGTTVQAGGMPGTLPGGHQRRARGWDTEGPGAFPEMARKPHNYTLPPPPHPGSQSLQTQDGLSGQPAVTLSYLRLRPPPAIWSRRHSCAVTSGLNPAPARLAGEHSVTHTFQPLRAASGSNFAVAHSPSDRFSTAIVRRLCPTQTPAAFPKFSKNVFLKSTCYLGKLCVPQIQPLHGIFIG